MKQVDRVNLVSRIALELQARMRTTQINAFLSGLGVECDDVSVVDSKRAYVEGLLRKSSDTQVAQVAAELGIEVPTVLGPGAQDFKAFLGTGGLAACQADFGRALASVQTDPDAALTGASSTLESIAWSMPLSESEFSAPRLASP